MEHNNNADVVERLPLKALGLRSGMALQTRRLVEGASKTEAQFFGAIEGKGVMVGPAGAESTQTGLEAGEVCIVRGFTGMYEFSFLSKVLQTFETPFAYALLAYPAQVDAKRVRQSLRTKVSWPSQLKTAQAHQFQTVQLVDLSLCGAMVTSPTPLGAVGDVVTLKIDAPMSPAPLTLLVSASICHHNKPMGGEQYIAGMAFQALAREDTLVLSYLTRPNTGA